MAKHEWARSGCTCGRVPQPRPEGIEARRDAAHGANKRTTRDCRASHKVCIGCAICTTHCGTSTLTTMSSARRARHSASSRLAVFQRRRSRSRACPTPAMRTALVEAVPTRQGYQGEKGMSFDHDNSRRWVLIAVWKRGRTRQSQTVSQGQERQAGWARPWLAPNGLNSSPCHAYGSCWRRNLDEWWTMKSLCPAGEANWQNVVRWSVCS